VLSNFLLRNLDHTTNEQFGSNPIIIEKQGDRSRIDGGKYETTFPSIFGIVAGVLVQTKGHRRLTPSEEGVLYMGTQEFQLVMEDIVALGITNSDTTTLRIYHDGVVYRVKNQQWIPFYNIVRYTVERTVDVYPSLAFIWTFQACTVGEEPDGDWVSHEPTLTLVEILYGTEKVLTMLSMTTGENGQIYLPFINELPANPREVRFDWGIGLLESSGACGYIAVGEVNDMNLADPSNTVMKFDVAATSATEVTLSWGSVYTTTLTTTGAHRFIIRKSDAGLVDVWIDDEQIVTGYSCGSLSMKYLVFQGVDASGGCDNIMAMDNVEASVI